MISILVSVLAMAVAPELGEPSVNQIKELKTAIRKIEEGDQKVLEMKRQMLSKREQMIRDVLEKQSEEIQLPLLTGQMLTDGLGDFIATLSRPNGKVAGEESDAEGFNEAPLVLSGLIQTSDGRVAIVSDGSRDFVVAKGSYLPGRIKVLNVEKDRLVVLAESPTGQSRTLEIRMATP